MRQGEGETEAIRQDAGGERSGRGRPAGRPLFIGSEIYRRSSYGLRHPLAIPRVSTCIDLCRALGWLPDEVYIDSPLATPGQLARFHAPDYIAAVRRAESGPRISDADKRRYNIGINGNPVFPEIFSRPATACGGSILAAELIAEGGTVYSPAGGTHHGRPDRASGFCYFNDPVLAILGLLDHGLVRVGYLDLDAHHGDGVQAAFAEDERVLTISLHEAGRWPMDGSGGGGVGDRAGGQARNLPVPPGFNDSELDFLLEAAILPLLETFEPQALVLQCGADALAEDPLSKLALSLPSGASWPRPAPWRRAFWCSAVAVTIPGPSGAAGAGSGRRSTATPSPSACRRRPRSCCASCAGATVSGASRRRPGSRP
jgi:acetoin utilization protein AcuC